MKKQLILMIASTYVLSACTAKPPIRPGFSQSAADGTGIKPNTPPKSPTVDPISQVDPKLELTGLPSEATDELRWKLNWTARPEIKTIGYSEGETCSDVSKLKEVALNQALDVELPESEKPFALCVVAKEGDNWLSKYPKTISIPRKIFSHVVESKLKAKLPGCSKESELTATFSFSKTKGTLKGTLDSNALGCTKQISDFTIEILNIVWMDNDAKAAWKSGLLDAGWVDIHWEDKTLKDYQAKFGYGAPELKKVWGTFRSANSEPGEIK